MSSFKILESIDASSVPNSPMITFLSNVAVFEHTTFEVDFKPLSTVGCTDTKWDSPIFFCVVIKSTITSDPFNLSEIINAGRTFSPQ